jgi:hypothetical protein
MLGEAALLLCLASNATADVGGRAEVRAGVISGVEEVAPDAPAPGPASSVNLRLRPQGALTGHRPGLDGLLSYSTDLRLNTIDTGVVSFASHNFSGSISGGRTEGGAAFRLNGSLSLGEIQFDPVLDDEESPIGLASQGGVVPFTSSSAGGSLTGRPAQRWTWTAGASGRLFFVPLLDENGEVIPDLDPEVRFGPVGQASLEHDLTRQDRVGLQLRSSTILGPTGVVVYSDVTATAGWSRDILPAWPLSIRWGWMLQQQPGFSPGVLPVGSASLTARFPAGFRSTVTGGLTMGYDAFNDAGAQRATASWSLSRSFGRAAGVSLSTRAVWRLFVITRRAVTGDDFVGVARLSGTYTMSDNLFFEGGAVFSSRYRAFDERNVLQGQVFIAAQGGAGWES